MAAAAAAHGAAGACLEVLGGGVMSWRRDRSRHLQLSAPFAAPGAPPGPNGRPAAGGVATLAATLARGALPLTHRVTLEGAAA
jgi:hypothetical protein